MSILRNTLKRVLPERTVQMIREAKYRWARMTGPMPFREFSDYDDYWKKRKAVGTVLPRWQFAAEEVEDGSSVLDIGCGSGEFLEYLQSQHSGLTLEGTDVSKVAVESTQAKGFAARVVDMGTEEIAGTYDYITCFEVLEHIPEAEVALRRFKQAFRRKLIISIPNVGSLGCRLRLAIFGRFPVTVCIYHIKEHVRHWTPKDFAQWMHEEGLKIVSMKGQHGPSWLPWRKMPCLFANAIVYVLEREVAK